MRFESTQRRNPGASQPQAVKEGIPGSTRGACGIPGSSSNHFLITTLYHTEEMPRLVAQLHARPLSPWERAGVRVLGIAKIAIKANLRGLGYGG